MSYKQFHYLLCLFPGVFSYKVAHYPPDSPLNAVAISLCSAKPKALLGPGLKQIIRFN